MPYGVMRFEPNLTTVLGGVALLCGLFACAPLDPEEVGDEDLTVEWCPQTGETNIHFDFGVDPDGTLAPHIWEGGHHLSLTGPRSGMGQGAICSAPQAGRLITAEDWPPMTPGRIWRLTARGEMLERPDRLQVHVSGLDGGYSSRCGVRACRPGDEDLRARFDLSAPSVEDDSGCQLLVARLRAPHAD